MKKNAVKEKISLKKVLGIQLIIAISMMLISFAPATNSVVAAEQSVSNVTVKGTITDSGTKRGINGATIQAMETDIKVTTKKNGTYKITFPGNATKLIVTCPGYQPLEILIAGRKEINVAISLLYVDPEVWN